jgi:alpha-D-ribose 1-methylphosphonate 5-triphosphate diphosphatase
MNELLIRGVRVVLPDRVIDSGWVLVSGGLIAEVGEGPPPDAEEILDGEGRWLLPGLIDIHNDAIEREMEPRPRALFPLPLALNSLENRLVSHGITTIFHSLAFMDGRKGLSRAAKVRSAAIEIARLAADMSIRHMVHARCEIPEPGYGDMIEELAGRGQIHLLSVMDHTPGQGQYKDVERFARFLGDQYHMKIEDANRVIRERQAAAEATDRERYVARIIAIAAAHGIPLASHDDDSVDRILTRKEQGIRMSEFPVDLDVALHAASEGMFVVVGAPNIVLGGSNTGNMRAMDAVVRGAAQIVCSDYYSPAVLASVFRMAAAGLPMHHAVRMATLNPARAVGLGDSLGSIESGKRADLVVVEETEDLQVVAAALVEGRKVFEKTHGRVTDLTRTVEDATYAS